MKKIKVDGKEIEVPEDYEPCGTCGFDHAYDLLSSEQYQKQKDHQEAEKTIQTF